MSDLGEWVGRSCRLRLVELFDVFDKGFLVDLDGGLSVSIETEWYDWSGDQQMGLFLVIVFVEQGHRCRG